MGKNMRTNFVSIAREAVEKYQPESVDLQHLLAVILGESVSPELCRRLAAIGVRELSKMSTLELMLEGLTKMKAQQIMASFALAKKWAESKEIT
ncbi:hypothetical protein J2S00_004041 [Caldalkalibacillus uzonensis]|uniref:Clp R domain-containing protein n=1 Tax=Caldalkalibacillus uzonensis TaxID=353224 RepID=A0ABU0CYG5_9BACI|nr:hypothetical protein [Caldalkalibacillus uzonensis]MDQ0341195.1 hypothetical protein [Caldalkalibacillus uzonensis]